MKISSRIDYALSCLLHVVAAYDRKESVSVPVIAEKEHLDTDYVEQLLITLKRAGIVKSLRGVNGGYQLTDSPDRITAYDFMNAFEKDILELVCRREKGRKIPCIHVDTCQVRGFWEGLRGSIEQYLRNYTLAQLAYLRHNEKTNITEEAV